MNFYVFVSLWPSFDPARLAAGAPFPNFWLAAQRDFAARLKWSVTPRYEEANHAPEMKIEGPLNVITRAGQKVPLKGFVSDPDGNSVTVRWWPFKTGSYAGDVMIVTQPLFQLKSSFLQILLPDKLAIVYPKPQTTLRHYLHDVSESSSVLSESS